MKRVTDIIAAEAVYIAKGETRVVPSKVAIEFPTTCFGIIYEVMHIAIKGVRTGASTIESGAYVDVILTNVGNASFVVSKGEIIAKVILHEYVHENKPVESKLG